MFIHGVMTKSKFAHSEAVHTSKLPEISLDWENVFQNLKFRNKKIFFNEK